MAVDKQFLQNLQDLVANKLSEKEEVIARKDEQIATKDKEITSKDEEITHLRQMLDDQKNQMGKEIDDLKREILRLNSKDKKVTKNKDEEIPQLGQHSTNKQTNKPQLGQILLDEQKIQVGKEIDDLKEEILSLKQTLYGISVLNQNKASRGHYKKCRHWFFRAVLFCKNACPLSTTRV